MTTATGFRISTVSPLADEPTLEGLVEGIERGLLRSQSLWSDGLESEALELLRQVRTDYYRHRDLLKVYGGSTTLVRQVEGLWRQIAAPVAA